MSSFRAKNSITATGKVARSFRQPTMEPLPGETEAGASIPVDQPGTPEAPPYSPLTPTFAELEPVAASGATIVPPPLSPSPTTRNLPEPLPAYREPLPPAKPAVFKPEPPPVPISESENPDAIALRSALNILQIQKQQSLRDLKTLDRLKEAAAAHPEEFARDLFSGRLRTEDRGAILQFTDDDSADIDKDPKESGQAEDDGPNKSRFGRIPAPQNVVRMPPVNWDKYHIIGAPLERMHQQQLRRPSSGEPRRDPAPEHLLAAPYRPLVDHLDKPTRLGRPSKSKK